MCPSRFPRRLTPALAGSTDGVKWSCLSWAPSAQGALRPDHRARQGPALGRAVPQGPQGAGPASLGELGQGGAVLWSHGP